jgi:glutathione S-transferase
MKLYYSPGACSLAPHIVLREAGQVFTLSKVDTAKHATGLGEDYYTINPKGMVPLLELDDGSRLSEGPVIAQFIADRAGSSNLMPAAGSIERYRVMEWQNYITSELHKSFTPLFNPELDTAAKQTLSTVLRKKLQWVDGQLSSRDFLTGKAFTAADAYLFTVLGWAKYVNLQIADLINIQRFMSTVAQRPAVREAMKAEGLLADNA